MKIQKSKLLPLIILLILLIISSCNTTEKISQSDLDKNTGQLIKEIPKIKGCPYSDGSICSQICCKTGISCDDKSYSYKRCDISNGIWDFRQYKNFDCTGSCVITNIKKFENKKEIGEEAKKEVVETKLPEEKKVTTCSSGWKCKDTNYKGYQLLDCSWITISYCDNGCIDGKCLPKNKIIEPVPTTSIVVSEIIDGDTIKLQSGEKIRLIGINTPEINQYYYPEAKNKLKELVEGKIVKLEKDISNVDRYGRLLRYIYVDDLFVNLEMVRLGYAEAYKYPPDVKYFNLFEEAENEAKAKSLGIWKTDEMNYIVDKCFNIINFHYNAAGNDNYNLNDEYFTLKNSCSYAIDLTDWTIKDEATHIYTFSNFNLGTNAQITLYTGSGQDTSSELYWKMVGAVWNNDGDTLFLRDKNGNLVLEEKY